MARIWPSEQCLHGQHTKCPGINAQGEKCPCTHHPDQQRGARK